MAPPHVTHDPAPRRAALITAAVVAVVSLPTLNRLLVGVFYDDGLYAGLALALARGEGYVHPHLPGSPQAVHYPPLYPAVLAPLFGLLPLAAAALAAKVLNLALGAVAAGVLAGHALRRRLLGDGIPVWAYVVTVAAAATAIPALATQSVLFAEPLFALLFVATVAVTDQPPTRLEPRQAALLAGSLAALALLTRSIGVALGGGAMVYALWRRRVGWSQAVLLAAPLAVAALAWGWWVTAHQGDIDPALALNYGSYFAALGQSGFAGMGGGARDLPRPLVALTLGWVPGTVPLVALAVLAGAVLIAGLVRLIERTSAGLALVGYGAILAVWPYPPDRFLWVVLPWLALAFVAGAVALWARRALRGLVAVAAAAVVLGFAQYQVRGIAGRWWEGAARNISATFADLLPVIRELPADAVVATDDEALVWLYTSHRAVPLYLFSYSGRETVEPDAAAQRAFLERQGVTHVLLAAASGESARQLRGLIAAYPGWLEPVHRWHGGRWLFAVKDRP